MIQSKNYLKAVVNAKEGEVKHLS